MNNLTPRQKAFIDNTLLIHTYRTITNAYREELITIEALRAVDRSEARHQAFVQSLKYR